MWNLEWTASDWITWEMQLSKLDTKEPRQVFIGHTRSHWKGSKRFLPCRTPPLVGSLLLAPFIPLFTRTWMLLHHPELVRNCSFCSRLAPPMMLTLFLAPKWSCLPCQQNAPFGVVWTAGFDVTKVIHIRAWMIDWEQSGGGDLAFPRKLLPLLFLRQMTPLWVDYMKKPLWWATFYCRIQKCNGYRWGQSR